MQVESVQNYQNDVHKNGYQFEYGKTVRFDTRRTGKQLGLFIERILHTHVTNRLKDGTKLQDQTSTNDKTADMNNSKAEKEEKTEPILN
ncbi:unnamed protein product [Rhizophagus irregularis]|nr:unnamed protein product [Rhizophagus irregularis]